MPRFLASRVDPPQEIPENLPNRSISHPFLPLNPLHPQLHSPHEPTSGNQSSYQFFYSESILRPISNLLNERCSEFYKIEALKYRQSRTIEGEALMDHLASIHAGLTLELETFIAAMKNL